MKKIILFIVSTIILAPAVKSQQNALQFDGVNDQVTLPFTSLLDFSLNSKFTIEGWFKTSANTAVLFSNLVDNFPFKGYEVAVVNSKLAFSQANTDLTNQIRMETVAAVNDGQWHHFACVYKGIPNANTERIYIDGVVQAVLINTNNLTLAFNTGNAAHIGCRNNTTYFTSGYIDEIRVWNKALCAAEIVARKNCQLTGSESLLIAYFDFNQGVASSNNSGITTLPDIAGNGLNGTLSGFSLNNSTSNWVSSNVAVTGTCAPFVPVSITGANNICAGQSAVLVANGANSYTWSTFVNTPSISVSPTVTTTYSVSGLDCDGSATFTLNVSKCTSIDKQLSQDAGILVSPNPGNGLLKLQGCKIGMIITVCNFAGQTVYSEIAESSDQQIDIGHLRNGIYMLTGTFENTRILTRKIIKE